MTSAEGRSKEGLDALLQFTRQQVTNPDPITDYFRIPDRLPPAWQTFFDKVLAYCERACAADYQQRIAWEKRGMLMEDEGLDEFEMLMSSTSMKTKGDEVFKKGDLMKAFSFYLSSIQFFPTPDAMLNVAHLALKQNRWPLAETQCTNAIDIDLIATPAKKAKAYYRRAGARLHLGKFAEAHEDIRIANSLHPGDSHIETEAAEIERLLKSHNTAARVAVYVAEQPKPPPMMTFQEGMALNQGMGVTRIPPPMDMRMVSPPTF